MNTSTRRQAIGVHAIGVYLPDEVRSNDWWPSATVAKWRERGHWAVASREQKGMPTDLTPGMRAATDAMAKLADDPFKGSRERRIAPADMPASEMEIRAAREAITRAGISPDQIEVLLVHSTTPDFLNVPNACRVHQALGLPERCFAMSVDGMCNAFQMQLKLAQSLLRERQGGFALLVQSCNLPRFAVADDPASAWVGEGATAVLLGPVHAELGLLTSSHRADGSKFKALVVGVEGKNWYDEGRTTFYSADRAAGARVALEIPDQAKQVIDEVLLEIGSQPADVAFYAAHQGVVWLREVTQRFVGMDQAKSLDTFSRFASLSAANIPLVLAIAERERLLSRGDLTMLFSGGTGQTWSSTALRWGKD